MCFQGLWLAATASIVLIGLCEILGVAVTPLFMRKENQPFYKHLIQFLVALAVGTMAGDALLHLYPHALLAEAHQHGHNHHDEHGPDRIDYHNATIWKGFAGVYMISVCPSKTISNQTFTLSLCHLATQIKLHSSITHLNTCIKIIRFKNRKLKHLFFIFQPW